MFVFIPFVIGVVAWMLYELFKKPVPDVSADGKAFLVTGAASGIGLATTRLLLRKGAHVYAADVNDALLKEKFGSEARVRCVHLDVTKQADVDKFVRSLGDGGGSGGGGAAGGWPSGLYGVVNSAGVAAAPGKRLLPGVLKTAVELDCDTEQAPVIDINLLGTMRVVNGVAPHVIASKGVIVNLASVAGRFGVKGGMFGAYCASKHGVNGITKCWRYELAPLGVRVYALEPWFIRTPMVTYGLDKGAQSVSIDTSQTKYPQVFNHDAVRQSFVDMSEKALDATDVAEAAERLLLSSRQLAPHVIVAPPFMKVLLTVISTLPHTWQDTANKWIAG